MVIIINLMVVKVSCVKCAVVVVWRPWVVIAIILAVNIATWIIVTSIVISHAKSIGHQHESSFGSVEDHCNV